MTAAGIKYSQILLVIVLFGCSGLRIRDFSSEPLTDSNRFLTSQTAFNRNAISVEELKPPLREDWDNDYVSLPNNGFTVIDNWLLFGTYNGYLAVADLDDGALEGKKNLGDACAVPPTINNTILYQSFESGSNGLVAYDISKGSVLWEVEENFSRSSPVVSAERVLFQTLKGDVLCYQAETGEEIWKISLERDIRNSPALSANTLISVTLDGLIVAININTGEILWEHNLKLPVLADPVIDDNRIYILAHTGFLEVRDLATGEKIHQKKIGIQLYHSPTIDDLSIYIATSNGRLISLDKVSFRENWIFEGEGPISGPALVSNSYIYFSTLAKYLYILDKHNGQLLQSIEIPGRARSTPIIKGGKLVLACEEKQVIAYVENN